MDTPVTTIGSRSGLDEPPQQEGPPPGRPGSSKPRGSHDLQHAGPNRRPTLPPSSAPSSAQAPQLAPDGPRRSFNLPVDLTVHGERKAHLDAGARAGTQGRGGHASAGISADLAAQVRGQAGAGRPTLEDLTAPLLAINGEAQAGASFDQYARAGLPPLRLANETLVDEPMGVGQKSHGFVGARAEAKGSVGPTHAQGHVEAFAGAKTGGQAELTLGDQRFKVNGDLRAGIGLDASASAGLKRTPEGRTRLQLEGRLGGALGVGGAIGGGVDVDVTPVADAVDALPRPARNGLKSLVHTGGRIVKAAADVGKAAVKAVGKVAKEVVTAPVRFIKSLFS